MKKRGGKKYCKQVHNQCRRERRANKNGDGDLPSADSQLVSSLYQSMIDKESYLAKVEALSPSETSVTINQFGENHLFFDHNSREMHVNGQVTKYTKKTSPQMTESILSQLSEPPLINEHSNAITKIVFPNGTINYVFHARRDSKCEALSDLHQYLYDDKGQDIQDLLNAVPESEWKKDELGGGRYLPIGFGTLGTFRSCKHKGVPHMRKPFKTDPVQRLSPILGGIMSRVGRCISKYSPVCMKKNRVYKHKNERAAFPFLEDQDFAWNFFPRRWS